MEKFKRYIEERKEREKQKLQLILGEDQLT